MHEILCCLGAGRVYCCITMSCRGLRNHIWIPLDPGAEIRSRGPASGQRVPRRDVARHGQTDRGVMKSNACILQNTLLLVLIRVNRGGTIHMHVPKYKGV